MTRLRLLLLASALATAPAGAFGANQQVTIGQHTFMPGALSVRPGDTVTWINKDTDAHSVRSNDRGKTSHSNLLDPGQSFTLVFSSPGTFSYYCGVHPDMQGAIVVK